jgi:hypothetical protein
MIPPLVAVLADEMTKQLGAAFVRAALCQWP